MKPADFGKIEAQLKQQYPDVRVNELDVMSAVQYPKVYDEYAAHAAAYGNVSVLPTRQFLAPMKPNETVAFTPRDGSSREITAKFVGVRGDVDADGYHRCAYHTRTPSHISNTLMFLFLPPLPPSLPAGKCGV